MTHRPAHAVIWTELPVSDLDRAIAFYNAVFDWDLAVDESGPNPMATIPTKDGEGVAGHLYPGTPAPAAHGPTIHFTVPGALEDAVSRARDAGAEITSEPIAIPPGRFVYATDPDGNSIGLYEPKGNE